MRVRPKKVSRRRLMGRASRFTHSSRAEDGRQRGALAKPVIGGGEEGSEREVRDEAAAVGRESDG